MVINKKLASSLICTIKLKNQKRKLKARLTGGPTQKMSGETFRHASMLSPQRSNKSSRLKWTKNLSNPPNQPNKRAKTIAAQVMSVIKAGKLGSRIKSVKMGAVAEAVATEEEMSIVKLTKNIKTTRSL